MLAICIPSMLYFTSIHHHCPHASYMYTQHALLYFYSSPLPSCQLYVYLACSTLLLFITTALMLAICIPSMLYFTSIHHHCPHASYMYTQHALLYFYSSPQPTCQLYVYLACFTLLLFIITALMLAICIPSMLYFTSIHHHCPHASYMYTQHALLYFYSSPLPSCQLYVYLECSTLLLFITTALMLAICIPSMLYFTSIHHHCPHASYMYTQHALLYFYSSPLPSCQLYVYLACSTLLLFIITALMLAICIPSMLYFTSIHHHCPHASYMYTQHALLYFYSSSLPSCQLYVDLACFTLLLFITTAHMLAICIPSMLYFTSIHHHCPHASYMYTQHALLYFYSSPLPSCQLYVYLACSTLLLLITTALMLAICIPSMLYFTSIHHHCPHASYMYTQHALLYFYSSPQPTCQLYVYLACSTLLLFITTALMRAICISSMLYFTSIHHHCPHASYMQTQHALLYFYSSPQPTCQLYVYLACFTLLLFITTAHMLAICIPSMLYFTSIHHHCPHASYMYTQHALLYFYSSPLPSCQLYVYLACSTLLLFITTALMLAICIPSMLYFTSIHHHCPHASYMYTQHALLYIYSSSLPSCQLYVYLACSTLLLFIITALMLAICIASMLYFTSIHHHCPHASYMYTQHALLYFYSSPLPSCQLYVYLACSTLLLFIITALMLAICIPSMLYFTSIHHHSPHASYMYTQHALLYFYSSPLPSCQLYVYLACSTLLLFIITALMLAICRPSMLYFTSIHHHSPHASYMYTQHALLYFYSSPLPSCQLYVYLACFTLLLFISTALMLAICIPSMLYFTSTHHHCPHASYMYTQHALLYFYSSPLPSCQLYVYLACFTLLLFITTAHMLAICIPSMLYFTSIHHHCPHASYMYIQHALLYFYSSSLPSCQLYVDLACFTLLLFITTALMLAICIPSMLYFTSIHHHCPHASYMYTQHALLYFYSSSSLPSCQLYVYLACFTLLIFIITALMLAICIPSMLYFTSIHHHCPHASYMYTQNALLYFYSSPLPSCQLYVYLACFTLLLFITTALMLAICIPSMLYFTSIHHHCPHASYMYTQHALLYFYSSSLPSCQLYVYLACSTLLLFITTALMLAICIPSMLYFTSIHHHCPHASYMQTQHALLYFYSSPQPTCQLYVYLACFTLLLFITTALMLAICIPSMLYFTSIHLHCPHASYMYTQHALLYFYSSPLPSCQLYVYLACSTLLLFITTALMLAICIPSMLYFTSIHHHSPHASYMYTQHALLYFYSSPLPSCQLYVYLACFTLLLFIITALMLAICIPSMLYFTSIHHHSPHASYMYTQHALLYFYSSPQPTCQLYVYLACFTLLLFITTALMLAICIPSMLYFTSIHHHCPHASYMYTQHALLYFYSSPLPSCQLYVYLACSTLLLFITTALMLAICIPSMLYFTSIHHHCPHASYMYTQHALLYFYSSSLPSCQLYVQLACSTLLLFITTALMLAICIPSMLYFTSIHHHCPHASYMYTQHALLYFYSSSLPSCQLYVYLACSTLLLFITTVLMLAICIPSMLYFTSIHHHCPHASYMYTQHALLYFYSSPLPSCQLNVYLACFTLLLFITTALMLAICIPSMLYFTSIHHHSPHASYMYTQHALLYFYSSSLPSCQLYVYLACFTLLLFIITALMLAICIPSMLYFTSIHHHCPHASYMYTQNALLYFYSSPLPSCQLYVYLACFTLLLFITTALMLAICIPNMLYFTSIHHHCPYASYMYTQHALLYFYSSTLPSCQLYVYLACSTLLLFITTALMLAICIPSMLYFTSIHHHCPHASYMQTQHALLYFYSSPQPTCQLYVYLACFTLLLFITTALMLAICIPSMLYFTSIHLHCPHASYMYTQHALLYFYSSPLPSCQLYVYLACSTLLLFITTALMLAICIPSMLYFTSIHHHSPHASYMYTQHALLYFYSYPLPSCQQYVYLASFTLLLFITTAHMLAIYIPSMLYFTSIHHHSPHASYMYTQHALLYFYSSPLPSCQLYVYLACFTLLLFITSALMLAICIPSMLYFTSIHHHCPHASYMYTQHALLYFNSSPLPSCQLYVYLACSTLLPFIITALMLAICIPSMLYFTSIPYHCPHVDICIPSMLYFTSIHHHCPHSSYMYNQHALLYFYSSPLPTCQLYVYLACSTLLLFISTARMLAICIPSMLYFTSIHHHCPHDSYMYTQHALLYFNSSPLPSCQLYVYLACSTLLLFIITALMLGICIPSMLYFTSISHHCPHVDICIPSMLYFTSIHHHCLHSSYMYTQHTLLYFYSSPLPTCWLYVYLACSTLLLFISTARILAICIPSMLYFTSIHHHCPHASYMYTQHALLYFYSSPLPSCQLYVYLACSTLLLFITTAVMLTICIPILLYFTSIHHHCPHASYMYTQHDLLYFYSSSLPSCQLYVYLACSTLLLFIITALMLAICIPSILYFTSIHHHCPHASYMYTQHALLYFSSSSLPSCQLYVYLSCSTLLLFITTALMLAICTPSMLYLTSIHHHYPHASYMYTQHALLYFYSSPLPTCQLYLYLACSTLILFISTALMLAICIPSILYFTSIHHHCPLASYMYTQHALHNFYSSPLPSCQLYVYLACYTLLLFITTELMRAICVPSMLYLSFIHHHCPNASCMYTQHALLYFYSSSLPSCQLYVYLACSTLLLFITTALMLAICIPSILYFTSIHHHCPHASYMYTQHALLYFYSSPLPSCQLFVYLACST